MNSISIYNGNFNYIFTFLSIKLLYNLNVNEIEYRIYNIYILSKVYNYMDKNLSNLINKLYRIIKI